MRIRYVMAVVALSISPLAYADCSVEQRVELAKAGYEKSEIESLCAGLANTAQPERSSALAKTRSGIELLSQASIVGSNREDREKRRCAIVEGGVAFENDMVPFEQMVAFTQKNINAEKQEMFFGVKLRPARGMFTVACNVIIVDNWRYKKDDNTLFQEDVKKYQAEYEAVVRDLKSRNVDIKGAASR